MRRLTGNRWGADRKALKAIYIWLIWSVMDYGCVAFTSAADTVLKKLDCIQYQALQLCSGEFKPTSVAALHVELGEMWLKWWQIQLLVVY